MPDPSHSDPQVARRRYPIEPLLQAMGATLSGAQHELGIGGPEYRRYRDEGMSRDVAERKALKAGFHPYEVWPAMVEDDMVEAEEADRHSVEQRRAADARRKRKQYARRRDEILERNRRYRQEARQAISVQRRRRYREQADVERERSRRYYEANRERMKEAARRRRAEARKAV